MSNKNLIIIITVIFLVFAGSVVFFRLRSASSSQPLQGTDINSYTQNQQKDNNTNLNNMQDQTAESQQDQKPTSTPGQVAGDSVGCKRDFDANKLQTAKVAIAGRQVEMNVKDFGKITLQFYDKDAPKAVESFLRLTNSGYFDCLTFHRVAKGFVIQGGDPSGTGSGGESAFGKPFADELNPDTASYKAGYVKGVLAMANSGPNTNGSQFFIMLGDVALQHNYTIFGKVTAGQDVVDKIGQVDITPQMGPNDGAPKTPVVIQSVKIIK